MRRPPDLSNLPSTERYAYTQRHGRHHRERVHDLEYLLAHLPQDLDARFAGADARAGARFDQLSIRLQTIETRVRHVEQAVANNGAKLQAIETRVQAIEARAGQIEQAVANNGAKLDEILSRLPPKP